ncbi:MAG: septum formation initiator [Desulfitobacteriaceae bacterium]
MVVAQEKLEQQFPQISRRVRKIRSHSNTRVGLHRKSLLALVLVVAVAAGICAETIQLTVAKGAQIRILERDISGLKAQNDLLQVQADKLRSVGRIETAALAMGMEKPAGTVYVAGTLPSVKNQTGASVPQVAQSPRETIKPSAIKRLSQIFTSFFASTQR